ncbi:MAG: nucleotidyltransferase domain-containing protein, partial [Candidatus Entotheonellia bacterium]
MFFHRPASIPQTAPHLSLPGHMLHGLQFPEQRSDAIQILRQFVRGEGEQLRQAHVAGASGLGLVRQLAALIDQVIVGIHAFLSESPRFTRGPRPPRVGIVAIGGYGRGDLNPFSDIDIVLLHAPKADDLSTQFMIEFAQFLWDVRLPLSHSARSISNCIQMARSDVTAKTSYIEARPLVGDGELLDQFDRIVRRELRRKSVDQFIQAKAAELKRRHALYYGSVSVLEPNVKESPG